MQVHSYLNFNGRCEEAVEFYKRAVGAKVEMMMRYKESPDPPPPGMVAPGSENKVMHVAFTIGDTTVMASDGGCKGQPDFRGISLSLAVPDAAAADKTFTALADGGKIEMPLGKTFWSPRFGMLTDRFGLMWMVNVAA